MLSKRRELTDMEWPFLMKVVLPTGNPLWQAGTQPSFKRDAECITILAKQNDKTTIN